MKYKFYIDTTIIYNNKKYYINLNTYRNLHHHENSDLKNYFELFYEEQIKKLPNFKDKQLNITFQLIKKSKRITDKHNFYSVCAKYFYDALKTYGKIEDDNDTIILKEVLKESKYDKEKIKKLNFLGNLALFEITVL